MFTFKKLVYGVVCLSLVSLSPCLGADEKKKETVELTVDLGDGKTAKKFEISPGKEETIFSAMEKVKKKHSNFTFEYKGKKSTLFVTSIAGLKNKGSKGNNWVFRVNGKMGDKSIGVYRVKKGDQVLWKFGKYK